MIILLEMTVNSHYNVKKVWIDRLETLTLEEDNTAPPHTSCIILVVITQRPQRLFHPGPFYSIEAL
jgi:hypothetical protein